MEISVVAHGETGGKTRVFKGSSKRRKVSSDNHQQRVKVEILGVRGVHSSKEYPKSNTVI